MVRRTLGEAAPKLIDDGFLDQSNYASMNTVAFIIYGLSKFVTSHIAKTHLFLWYSILFGIVGVLTLLCGILPLLRFLGSKLYVYGNIMAYNLHRFQTMVS